MLDLLARGLRLLATRHGDDRSSTLQLLKRGMSSQSPVAVASGVDRGIHKQLMTSEGRERRRRVILVWVLSLSNLSAHLMTFQPCHEVTENPPTIFRDPQYFFFPFLFFRSLFARGGVVE